MEPSQNNQPTPTATQEPPKPAQEPTPTPTSIPPATPSTPPTKTGGGQNSTQKWVIIGLVVVVAAVLIWYLM
jgi:hypothetical protein